MSIERKSGKVSVSPHQPKKGGRKPSYKVSFIPSIRIMKRDIRRKYMEMLVTIKNSHDRKLQASFYQQYCHPQFTVVDCFLKGFEQFGMNRYVTNGYAHLIKTEALWTILCPDAIMRFTNYQICQRLHEKGSRIIGKVYLEGSFVYFPRDFAQELKLVQESDEHYHYDEDFLLNHPERFMILPEPLRFVSEGLMVITLDENHCFVKVESSGSISFSKDV